jgi:hypothetical protein
MPNYLHPSSILHQTTFETLKFVQCDLKFKFYREINVDKHLKPFLDKVQPLYFQLSYSPPPIFSVIADLPPILRVASYKNVNLLEQQ